MKYKKYYQSEPRFNRVYSRDNLPERSSTKTKNGVYAVNLDECSDIETHWVALYMWNNDITYFDFFGMEHICIGLDLLILCLKEKPLLNLLIFFHQITFKKMII